MGSSFSTSFSDSYAAVYDMFFGVDIPQSEDLDTLVLQTGKLRAMHISSGENLTGKLGEGVVHRWLPSHIESKYEALDFVIKFGLNGENKFNILDSKDGLVKLDPSDTTNSILSNVNIIVSCGSTSFQAFKIHSSGVPTSRDQLVIPLLPITKHNRDDDRINWPDGETQILGFLDDETLSKFGGGSDNYEVAQAIVDFLQANAVDQDGSISNIIFVNQIGYSVLGFNPRDGSPSPVPNTNQKVISLKYPDPDAIPKGFSTNNGKTQLISVLQNIMCDDKYTDNMYVVARQCKVTLNGKIEELSGQWARQARLIMKTEESLGLVDKVDTIDEVIDLGGGSGTYYQLSNNGDFDKDDTPNIMKEKGKQPNDFVDDLEGFCTQFITENS